MSQETALKIGGVGGGGTSWQFAFHGFRAAMGEDYACGVLLCGDALGRPVEFEPGNAIEPRHGMLRGLVGHGQEPTDL